MIRRPGGLGVGRHVWRKRRPPVDSRTSDLHALLDMALAAGATPIELEADLVYLLERARQRVDLDADRETPAGDSAG